MKQIYLKYNFVNKEPKVIVIISGEFFAERLPSASNAEE
jgi:hypothetical protein